MLEQVSGEVNVEAPDLMLGNRTSKMIWELVCDQLNVASDGSIISVQLSPVLDLCSFFQFSKEKTMDIIKKISTISSVVYLPKKKNPLKKPIKKKR